MSETTLDFKRLPDRVLLVGGNEDLRLRIQKLMVQPQLFEGCREVKKDDEIKRQIGEMHRALLEWGRKDFELDLNDRLPRLEKYHFYAQKEVQMIREKLGLLPDERGMADGLGDIHILENTDGKHTLQVVNHELIHLLSRYVFGLGDTEIQQVGYENVANKVFMIFNEAATEMTNTYVRQVFWKNREALSRFAQIGEPSYLEPVVLIDGMIHKAAEYLHRPPLEIFREMEMGLLNGKMNFVKTLANCFGRGRMMPLSRLSVGYDDSRRVAKIFGLDETYTKLSELREGEPVLIMEDIVPNEVAVMWE